MKDKDIRFEVKHVKLRTVAFVIAFVIAVGAFAAGIASFGKREDGYYVVTPDPAGDALFYASGIELTCWFEGTAREIRLSQDSVRGIYSRDLLRFYKLLDAENTYDGYANVASVNQSPGEWVTVPEDLYAVLEDAAALDEAYPQFSLTAGALTAEWNGILTLEEPAEADPLFSADEAERLAAITAAVNAENAAVLDFDPSRSAVRLTLSADYCRAAETLELSDAVVDLSVLHDAYYVQLIADALEGQGVNNGVITTESGLCLSLSDTKTGDYQLLSFADAEEISVGTLPLAGGAAACRCRTYERKDDTILYYTLEKDGNVIRRSPWICADTGTCADALLCAYTSAEPEAASVPSLVCEALRLLAEGPAAAAQTPTPGMRYDAVRAESPYDAEQIK